MTAAPTTSPRRASEWLPVSASLRDTVASAATLMIAAQLVLRGWAVYGGYFYSDDFIFLEKAQRSPLSLSFLFQPHDSHLMPTGIAITWVVAHAGALSWGTAATITLLLQGVASLCCLLMLVTLFGWRLRILVPLAFYLFATTSLDGFLWWSAALNMLPLHIAFFLAITAAVRHVRNRSLRTWSGTLGALSFGLLADPRGLLIFLSLGLVLFVFFASGRWFRRLWFATRTWWELWTPMLLLAVGYFALYRHLTPSPIYPDARTDLPATANTMLGSSFISSIVGGPWHWDNSNPPMAATDPPELLRILAIVVVISLLAIRWRRSPGVTTAAAAILVVHLTITYVGVAFGRATQIGPGAGLLMRFLADSTTVVTLTLALAFIPAAGATLIPREAGIGRRTRPRKLMGTVVVGAVVISSIYSTVKYVAYWHADYPARAFVSNAHTSSTRDPATVADVPVPELVQAATAYPFNLPSHLLYALRSRLTTATSGNDLRILDVDGFHRHATVPAAITAPKGPQPDCGYPVTQQPTSITLPQSNNADFWWMTLSYIAGGPARIDVRADGRRVAVMDIEPGVHTYFVQGEKQFSGLTLTNISEGTAACVDVIDVGDTIEPMK